MEKINRVREGWYEYKRLNERVEMLEAVAEKTTVSISGMPSTRSDGSTSGDAWAALIDYRNECEAQLRQYLNDCRELEVELNCIENSRIRNAMKYRYIDCLTVEAIAERMDLELRSTYRILKTGRRIYEEHWGR